jgi:hypothetical protein
MMDYLKYDGLNHEVIVKKFMYTPGALTRREVNWPNITYIVRDGKPVLISPASSPFPHGLVEQEINE